MSSARTVHEIAIVGVAEARGIKRRRRETRFYQSAPTSAKLNLRLLVERAWVLAQSI